MMRQRMKSALANNTEKMGDVADVQWSLKDRFGNAMARLRLSERSNDPEGITEALDLLVPMLETLVRKRSRGHSVLADNGLKRCREEFVCVLKYSWIAEALTEQQKTRVDKLAKLWLT